MQRMKLKNSKLPLPPKENQLLAFFKYSWTIFLARLTALSGLIVAGIGFMNWGPLLALNVDTGFSKNQIIWLGAISFVQGIATEIARRRTM